ncbi:MAG: hypothetical protein WAV05_00220 [Anaerolineales bacterium]
MDKKSDALLRKILKNWVNKQCPPENGRARLLWEAAQVSHSKFDLSVFRVLPQYRSFPSSSSNDWPQTLFTWISQNSFQFGIQARLS